MHIVQTHDQHADVIDNTTALPNDTEYVHARREQLSSMEIYFLIVFILAGIDAVLGIIYYIISHKDARPSSSSPSSNRGYGSVHHKNELVQSKNAKTKTKKGKMSARRSSSRQKSKDK